MAHLGDVIRLKTVQGTAVSTPHHTITPESRALVIRIPFGGLVWQWPTAVLVQQGEQTKRHAIVDVTRLATWSMLFFSLVFTLLLRLIKNKPE